MKKFLYPSVFLVFFLLFNAQIASAFELSPLRASLSVLGAGAEKEFTIKNTKRSAIAVIFSVDTRAEDLNGKESNKNADDSFMIYPPQTIIPPGATQRVRVRWIGNTQLKREQAYRFIAEEVPVQLSQKKTGVQMLLKIRGALYVRPKSVTPKIIVSNIRLVGKKLSISLVNTGTRHAYLVEPRLLLTSKAGRLNVNTKLLKDVNILAGAQRRFLVTPPKGFSPSNWKGTLQFKKIKD